MITNLDHIVLLTLDFEAAVAEYETLFGSPAAKVVKSEHFETALFATGNTGLEIMGPVSTYGQKRTAEILGDKTSALTSLAFCSDDPKETRRIFERRGARPGELSKTHSFRCDDSVCAGIKTFILPPLDKASPTNANNLRLDHLVINTPNPDRTIAHYGARLGIHFALDRTAEQFGARFMFFKLEDVVLEVIYRLEGTTNPQDDDSLWGITWKVDDLQAAHKRLTAANVTVSEIRTGRKPGTHVFTVKSHSGGIPTLFLAQNG